MTAVKLLCCLAVIAFLGVRGFSQSDNKENANDIYKKFAEAYSKLDAGAAASLYVSDALLIYLYENSQPSSIVGRENIKKSFADLFQNISLKKSRLNISFKIADRKNVSDEIFDNGFYQLEIITVNNEKSLYFGKFSAVLTHLDGQWKFKADTSASAKFEEFENIDSLTIPETENLLYPAFYDELLGDYLDEKNNLIVIGRSQTRLYAYFPTTQVFRGLKKINATTWTSGKNVISDDVADKKFVFKTNNQKRLLEIYDGANLLSTAEKLDLYKTEKLSFTNKNNIKLAGTLFLPAKKNGKAIVLVHGSGAQDRNGYASIIRLLADVLARSGVAVLTYDKQGIGESQGDWTSQSFSKLADDALAGIAYLKNRKDLNFEKIGLGGSSQAGWIMAKAVEKSAAADFVIAVGAAGSGISVIEQNLYNTKTLMQCEDFNQKQIEIALTQQKHFFDFLQTRKNGNRLDEFTMAAAKDAKLKDWLFPTSGEINFQNPNQWFTALEMDFEPIDVWRNYRKPALMIFSEFDDSTPTDKVISKLNKLNNKHLTLQKIPNAQHIGLATNSVCRSDLKYTEKFHPNFFTAITKWTNNL